MLSRGFYDTLSLWPVALWPIVFSSCLWSCVRLCRMHCDEHGFSPLADRSPFALAMNFGFLPAAAAFEVMAHGYMLMVVGYQYVAVAVAIYVVGWVLIPYLLDAFRPAFAVLAVTHLVFAGAFLVLLGFLQVGVLRALNADLYALATGMPTNI